ncbi:hypothetical protein AAG570_007661 [Ranatra chinensis]|uniref:5'-3' exoribonuclease n=1 Tax=Ranatra chinensis TaxID=642074 RepID=A0ABD0XVG9_9HEMI
MGVPAFFRWLTKKYPSIVLECIDERPVDANGTPLPFDASGKNPNDIEFDNLYLDMNGIIHPCTHPENKPAPKNEDEMMIAIFECIDHLFSIVRPRKLLYMAIDGVAPRAKMNQQRSRRFRASKESQDKIIEIASIKKSMLEKGYRLPPEKEKEAHFDSNCITPGTPFMARLAKCLNFYIHDRLNNDPGWKGVQVILSDANVPGEGEHKIMDFIRRQRAQPHHNPNTQHCLCGADADLIMLGLATHEPNFTIIREEFQYNQQRRCEICGQDGHEMKECQGLDKKFDDHAPKKIEGPQKYIFVRLNVLREYLARDLEMPHLPFEYDFERAIDDWVFMCFFVGNDFLPHLPSLEIREGAIDKLVDLYKRAVSGAEGFITDSGIVNLERVQKIMKDLGKLEDEIFVKRRRSDMIFKQRCQDRRKSEIQSKIEDGNFEAVRQLRNTKLEEEETPDLVKLWEPGYKDRYYELKFSYTGDTYSRRLQVAKDYVRGLCWVLKYYYQGCASWKWYYPYHYAPFASDFINIAEEEITFEKRTKPFSPLEQLMGVFPAASSSHVPKPYAELMTAKDSTISDFYPDNFNVDLNGKKYAWQGVALLPFVNEIRLKQALKPLEHLLTPEESTER